MKIILQKMKVIILYITIIREWNSIHNVTKENIIVTGKMLSLVLLHVFICDKFHGNKIIFSYFSASW